MGLEVKGDMIKRGEAQVSGPEKKEEEIKIDPADYSCEVILEKTTKDKADDRKLPSDAFNVFYVVEGEEHLDVTRSGKMANIFDFFCWTIGKLPVSEELWLFGRNGQMRLEK